MEGWPEIDTLEQKTNIRFDAPIKTLCPGICEAGK